MAESEVLRAPHFIEYTYTRSTGPVIGAFFTGLRDGKILGATSPSGKVVVPPTEYDPETSEEVGEMVEVGPGGVVTTWAWASTPLKGQPLERPFAWALVRLDGADTGMLHVVEAEGPEAMRSGMRVTVRWRPEGERIGRMADIECFVAEGER
jgi:uncharacterized OB-fold protein